MFCREQVAQLRDIDADIKAKGARIIAIGNGTAQQAAAFHKERELPFMLLTDPGRRSFKAAGLRRSMGSTFNPTALRNGIETMRKGFRQGTVQGDAWQQGGAFVIAPGDDLLYSFVSGAGGDHPDPQELVAALPSVA